MRDLTQTFLRAAAAHGEWSEARLRQALHTAASCVPGAVVEWDDEAIEQWGRVLRGDECSCLIRRDIPLAVVLPPCGSSLAAKLREMGLVVVQANEWAGAAFSVDREAMHMAFPDEVAWGEGYDGIDTLSFSVWDLWWATV